MSRRIDQYSYSELHRMVSLWRQVARSSSNRVKSLELARLAGRGLALLSERRQRLYRSHSHSEVP